MSTIKSPVRKGRPVVKKPVQGTTTPKKTRGAGTVQQSGNSTPFVSSFTNDPGVKRPGIKSLAVKAATEELIAAMKATGAGTDITSRYIESLEQLIGVGAHEQNDKPEVTRSSFTFGTSNRLHADLKELPQTTVKQLLGGKGANLIRMAKMGLAVPPGLVISTESCATYLETGEWPPSLNKELKAGIKSVENRLGRKFGDPSNPLLFSVRSGAAISMPGMMDTVLNLGLNDAVCMGLARTNSVLARDSYRRFIQCFADVVMGVEGKLFEDALSKIKKKHKVKSDAELTVPALKEIVAKFKEIYREEVGEEFPQEPKEQLKLTIEAVFNSWNNERAIKHREIENIKGLPGTGVTVQAMVFGNRNKRSGTGVCFTRDAATGEPGLYGEFLVKAQGEDVVAGVRTPMPLAEMKPVFPKAYKELERIAEVLEVECNDMQDIEFTIENGELFILQTRNGKRTGEAALEIIRSKLEKEEWSTSDSISSLVPDHIDQVLSPKFVNSGSDEVAHIATGIGASPGAAVGKIVFSADEAIKLSKQGVSVILASPETSPEDAAGMHAAVGILTSTGGKSSHAATVARGWGRPCVCGAEDLKISGGSMKTADGTVVASGDWVSIDGATGEVFVGRRTLVYPDPSSMLVNLLKDGHAESAPTQIMIEANEAMAVLKATELRASQVGTFRTDNMLLHPDHKLAAQRLLFSSGEAESEKALSDLVASWKTSFMEALRSDTWECDIALTLQLFAGDYSALLPQTSTGQQMLATELEVPAASIRTRARELMSQSGSASGNSGSLSVHYNENLVRAQALAIVEALSALGKNARQIEIQLPGVHTESEVNKYKQIIDDACTMWSIPTEQRPKIGASISTVSAALQVGKIAETCDFVFVDAKGIDESAKSMSQADSLRMERDIQKQEDDERASLTGFQRDLMLHVLRKASRESHAGGAKFRVGEFGMHVSELLELCLRDVECDALVMKTQRDFLVGSVEAVKAGLDEGYSVAPTDADGAEAGEAAQ